MKTAIALIMLTTSLMARQAPFYIKGEHDGEAVCTALKYEEGVGLWVVLPGHVVRDAGPDHTAYVKLRGEWRTATIPHVADFNDVAFALVPVSIERPSIAPLLLETYPTLLYVGDKNGNFKSGHLVEKDTLQGVVPDFGDSGAPVLTQDGRLAGMVIAQTSSVPTSQCFGPNCPNPNFGFQIGLPVMNQAPVMNQTRFVPTSVITREWNTFCQRPYVRGELAAVTLPPVRQGPMGPAGPAGPPQAPKDELTKLVDARIRTIVPPMIAESTDGLIAGTEVQRAIDLLKATKVPIRILNADGTIYSKDEEHRLADPIEIIAPEG